MAVFQKPVAPAPAKTAEGAGRSDPLDDLVRTHSHYVAGLAYRLLGSDADIDDVVQDVFVALLRFHAAIREPEAVRGWLATTTVRMAQKRLRARSFRVRSLLGLDDAAQASLPTGGGTQEEHAALRQVHRALSTVSASERVAWLLRYVEQERMEDVARLVGCSLTTAKRRVEAAQIAVKRALSDD